MGMRLKIALYVRVHCLSCGTECVIQRTLYTSNLFPYSHLLLAELYDFIYIRVRLNTTLLVELI